MNKYSIATFVAAFALSAASCDSGSDKPKDDKTKTAKKADKSGKDEAGKDKPAPDKAGKDEPGKDEAGKDAPAEAAMNGEVVLAAFKAFSDGNLEEASKDFSDDIVWQDAGAPPLEGKAAVLEAWKNNRAPFPDLTLTPTRVIEAEGIIVAQYTSHGTHKGEFMGNPPSDKPIGSNSVLFLWHEGGKVTKVSNVQNGLATLSQLGIAKDMPPTPIPEKPSAEAEMIKGDKNADNEAKVKEWYAAFTGDMKWEDVSPRFTEGAIHHDASEGKSQKTPEEHKANLETMTKAFPDVKIESTAMASAGDWVISWGVGTGTHKGDMGPIKATNKAVKISVAEVIHLEDGKIKESWSYSNPAEMLGQMGLLPAPQPETVAQK